MGYPYIHWVAIILVKTDGYTFTTAGSQISKHTVTAGGSTRNYTYTYDGNGNILSVSDGTNTTTYVYDSANQLTRENNQKAGKTWTWSYDNAGNIRTRKEYAYTTGTVGTATDTVNYTYGDSSWKDLLTVYDGKSITYETSPSGGTIGNLASDGTWTYTWRHGRQLATMTPKTGSAWNFTYDADGLRTKRTNGSTTYSYIYNGDKLSQMTVGSDTLKFAYDASGTPLSVEYNGTTYYYVTNIQGDVISIVNTSGTTVVEYTYDAWGTLLSTTGSLATSLGEDNPLRYRGYVYDTETALYYLQSRYYDPDLGRFLNADAFISTGQGILGNNMFAYCANNPICFLDPSGTFGVAAFQKTRDGIFRDGGPVGGGAGTALLIDSLLAFFSNSKNKETKNKTGSNKGSDSPKKPTPSEPDVVYPGDDPTKAPNGYEWSGPDPQGGKRGGYKSPKGDSWHPDLNHPDGVDPHWDYNDIYGHKWRVFPNKIEFAR